MVRVLGFIVFAGLLAVGFYFLIGHVLYAPRISLRLVVVLGSLLLVGCLAFGAFYWPFGRRNQL